MMYVFLHPGQSHRDVLVVSRYFILIYLFLLLLVFIIYLPLFVVVVVYLGVYHGKIGCTFAYMNVPNDQGCVQTERPIITHTVIPAIMMHHLWWSVLG